MAGRTALNVSLTPHLERFVNSRVSSGRYQSASEVVREGLRLLEERETAKEVLLRGLRDKIALGLEQARHGELLDGEQVFEELGQRTRNPKRRTR
jgi:antitoxin ParD1/3/4